MPAQDAAIIPGKLAELARALELTSDAEPAEVAVARLLGELAGRGRWLLVFDNVEDPHTVSPYLPPHGSGQVLITSRNPGWRHVAEPVPVHEFTRGESEALLRRVAPRLTGAEAQHVASAVGDLPLVVDQAASLLADTPLEASTYVQLLAERADDLLAQGSADTGTTSVTASWAVTFEWLAADSPVALDLLTLLAWFGPEPVPLTLLVDNADRLPPALAAMASDALASARCVGVLHRRALVTVTPHSVQLHRVPAALLRARTTVRGRPGHDWSTTVLRLLRAAAPRAVWNNPEVWPAWRMLLPHVLAVTGSDRPVGAECREVVSLLDDAGLYLHARGQVQAACDLFERTYHLSRTAHGADDDETLFSATNLARALQGLDQAAEARRLNEATLARRRRALGEDDPDTQESASLLARNLRELGELEPARDLNQSILSSRRRQLGDDDPSTLNFANCLARDLFALGQVREALQLNDDTLRRRRDVLGADHPDTLASAHDNGRYLHAIGAYEGARTVNGDTLARRQRVLGDDHPDTARSAENLASDIRALDDDTPAGNRTHSGF